MPRNSSGTYSLYTPGNPVVTQTVISSSWANNTLSDLATAITDSLSRSGDGGMLAGLELANGTSGAPGLSWGSDLTSGMYRAGASDFRWVNATVELLQLTTNLLQLSGTAPVFRINESDAAANNKLWDVIASGEDLNFRALTDALAATNWMTVARTAGTIDSVTLSAPVTVTGGVLSTVAGTEATPNVSMAVAGAPTLAWKQTNGAADNKNWFMNVSSETFQAYVSNDANNAFTNWLVVNRTGTTIDSVNFANGTLQYGGTEVGFRGLPGRAFSGNDSTAATDNGQVASYNGTGGHTFTIDTDFASGSLMTIINSGSGNLTIAESLAGSMFWFNGGGSIPTGSRTLAIGGICTVFRPSFDSNSAYVWGTGLT